MSILPLTASPVDPPVPPSFGTVEAAHAWAKVPLAEKARVVRWAGHCERLSRAGHGQMGGLVRRIAEAESVTESTVNKNLKRWREGNGCLLALVSRARVKDADGLNETFVQYWMALQGEFQRGNVLKQAHRALLSRWRGWLAGRDECALPGYDVCPRAGVHSDLPDGWSYTNLCRYQPTNFQKTLLRQGPKAAAALMPSVRGTRVGTKVGQIILWDDHWGDSLIIHPGDTEPTRPVGFFSMDFTSGMIVNHWWKPMSRRAGDGSREYLSAEDFNWYVLHHLQCVGVRQDTGTMLVVEHGSAAIREGGEMEKGLDRVLGDKLVIDRSGRYGQPAFRGMLYPGQGSGNFRHKANLESFFNLLENAASGGLAPSGRNPDEKPEEQYGLMRAAAWYLKVMNDVKLSPERKALLAAPVRWYQDYVAQSRAVIGALNERGDHGLGEWEACEFMKSLVCIAGEWLGAEQLAALPEEMRAEARMIMALPGRMRRVRMSPGEVWRAGARGLRRLAGWEVAGVVPESMMRVCRLNKQHEFAIQDRKLGDDPLYFYGSARDRNGHRVALDVGREYLVILNPHQFDRIQVLVATGSQRGAWIGECAAVPRVSRFDHEGAGVAFGQSQAVLAAARAEAQRMAEARIRSRQGDKAWNDRLIRDKRPVTDKEVAAAAGAEEAERVLASIRSFPAVDTAARGGEGGESDACTAPAPQPLSSDEEYDPAAAVAAALSTLPTGGEEWDFQD